MVCSSRWHMRTTALHCAIPCVQAKLKAQAIGTALKARLLRTRRSHARIVCFCCTLPPSQTRHAVQSSLCRCVPRHAPLCSASRAGRRCFAQILFHETDSSISLERNEIIALVNGLGKPSHQNPAHHSLPNTRTIARRCAANGARVVLCEPLQTLGHLRRRLLECAARHRGDAPS